jgi:DNA (cytosine-5)-methyltransferase 1
MPSLRYGSVCSGIEAATAAWHGLGWEPAWFSEIEPFPKAVLAHHYPAVPDLGDMTTLPAMILAGEIEAPDVLVGGTPCQSFSVAGLRKGLSDPRGQLTRTFVEILDAIDTVRHAAGKSPCTALWENVPGVLSDKDNAFGNFLGALVGEDCALEPSGGRWTDAGLVLGPTRQAAWRILDAQYFGVAQRRRRVFVVVSSRASDVRPVEVLLIEQGMRRDTPPSREKGERPAPTLAARTRGGGGLGTDFDLDGGLVRHDGAVAQAYPELPHVVGTLSDGAHNGGGSTVRTPTRDGCCPSIAMCLNAGAMGRRDAETETLLPVGGFFDPMCVTGDRTHALKAEGADGSEDGTGRGTPIVTSGLSVRRLTPTECERLQGFPDDYTRIPWKKRGADECPDGPRYKALGNSMAVPVIRWIGDRIGGVILRTASCYRA